MDSGNDRSDEVDIFDLTETPRGAATPDGHIETETNMFSVDMLKRAAAPQGGGSSDLAAPRHHDTGTFVVDSAATDGGDADVFDLPAPKQPAADAVGSLDDGLDDLDDLDDDVPAPKDGFFAKLIRAFKRKDAGIDDSIDDDLDDIISEPTPEPAHASGATDSGVFELGAAGGTPAAKQEPVAEQKPVVEHPPVNNATDSGIFEFAPVDSHVPQEPIPEQEPVAEQEPAVEHPPVNNAADSGIFEFTPVDAPAPQEPIPEQESVAEPEPVIEQTPVNNVVDSGIFEFAPVDSQPPEETVPEPAPAANVTDSGVFELGSGESQSKPEPIAQQESSVEPAPITDVTDSGVFELGSAEPPVAAAQEPVTDVTDSGVFELGPAGSSVAAEQESSRAPAAKSDEWEIGWEPVEEKAAEVEAAVVEAAVIIVEEVPLPPPPVFTKIAHVCLYVSNLAKSVEFYTNLGFNKRFVFNRKECLFGAYLEFGDGNFVELFEDAARAASATPGRFAHFCLETPDIDATTASLTARGIEFTPKRLGADSTYQVWLKDPDGNAFEIHQYTPNSSQLVGGEVQADWVE